MIAYHSLHPSSLPDVLKNGLKCTSRGAKGADVAIAKTDHFLDAHRPKRLIEAGICRDNSLYGYVASDSKIINIVDGKMIDVSDFIQHTDDILLKIIIDEQKCYVSDIDMFDSVKKAIEEEKSQQTLEKLATEYWEHIEPLANFTVGNIRRPEIMIPDDIPPANMTIINK